MRNLLIFITKYNAFFLFLIFQFGALFIYVKYNSFQKATFLNSANQVTGNLYARRQQLESYLYLQDENDRLARENAQLRNQLKSSFYVDSLAKHKVNDTVYHQQYEYTVARVINNSINKRNNYITIDKGTRDGIEKDMGVICSDGVVGVVLYVDERHALIQSFLHKDSKVSAMLADNKAVGSMEWGDDMDPQKALLKDVTNNIKPHLNEKVVTSGYSHFPSGIPLGTVINLHPKTSGFFLNMEVKLSVDFSRLQYVYVVNNKFEKEQAGLEARPKKDE